MLFHGLASKVPRAFSGAARISRHDAEHLQHGVSVPGTVFLRIWGLRFKRSRVYRAYRV